MKALHWILFALGSWIIASPLLSDDLIELFLRERLSDADFILLMRWDDLFLGLTILVIGLIVVTLEQTSDKKPGLKAMHWFQVLFGAWIAISPFALAYTLNGYTWSHLVSGSLVATYALIQLRYESA